MIIIISSKGIKFSASDECMLYSQTSLAHVHAKGAILQECESKEAGETNDAGPNDLEVSGGAGGTCGWGGG